MISKTRAVNLFRDSFPRFASDIKTRVIEAFLFFFFQDLSYENNEFSLYLSYPSFWSVIKDFHNNVYSRDMLLNEVIEYLDKYNWGSDRRKDDYSFDQRFSGDSSLPTPFPRDPGDDMAGAAAGMSRRYKDKKEEEFQE